MVNKTSRVILPEPPEELKCLSNKLVELIRAKIRQQGSIPFSEYMEMALYEPDLGYYSAGLKKFGEDGDFVTAPELGDVFARCLAGQITQIADKFADEITKEITGEFNGYEIIEAGAGSGVLAADLLISLENKNPPTRYRILERSAHLRQVQLETLQSRVPHWMDRVDWLDKPPESNWQGVFIANEVLDALTVERFICDGDNIQQLRVTDGAEGLTLQGANNESISKLVQLLGERLPGRFPDGFQSELNPNLPAWLDAVTASLERGVALFIDYGYPRSEYYLPQRHTGTLVCHYRHHAHDDPFVWPGLTDISASVDFTALAEAADQSGLDVSGYTTQAMFLLGCGLEEIIESFESLAEKDRINKHIEVRKLTLPDEMGERFQVMALSRGLNEKLTENLAGFSLTDLRYRL